MPKKNKPLSYEDMGNIYRKITKRSPYRLSFDQIIDWAMRKKDIFKMNKDGTFCLK